MKRIVAVVGVSLIVSGALVASTLAVAAPPKEIWREGSSGQTLPLVNVPGQASLAPLVKGLKPAVVNISTSNFQKRPSRRMPRGPSNDQWEQFFHRYFGAPREMPDEQRSSGLGSGFIINEEGYILTNNHVIKDATDIRVRTYDNREFVAKMIGGDSLTDVAVLKLEKPPKNLPTLALGDSDKAEQGDFVLAMGSPFGYRESVSFGIVSAKDRILSGGPYDDFIQTDAAINPGNSGGPLFNLRGEVIGINTAIVSPQIGQGIGFAVPINLAKGILPQLIAKGKVARGYLGVSVSNLTPDLAQAFGLSVDAQGAVVQQVMTKTPAARAGVQAGDLVVALNGRSITSSGELTRGVALIAPGGKADLTVLRGGAKKEIAVTVTLRPENEQDLADQPEESDASGEESAAAAEGKLGISLAPLTADLARELRIQGGSGVVVTEVTPGGPAERAGVQKGDLVVEVNRKPVTSARQMKQALAKVKPGELALLRIRRGSNAVFLAVRLGEK